MKKINDLTKGDIKTAIIAMALPIIGSSFLQMTYGIIDMIWVGKLGKDAIAAIGTASLFINFGFAAASAIVTGAGIKVSHTLGGKDYKSADEYIRNSFILNFLLGIIFIMIITIFKDGLIGFLDLNNPEVERMAKIYLVVTGIGLLFKNMNFLYIRILNSFGESKLPFKINMVGVVLNIILDPLLIFTFGLGVFGAAVATLISQILVTYIYSKKSHRYFEVFKEYQVNKDKMKDIIRLGVPNSVQRVLFTGFGLIVAKIVAKWGSDAIAAQKVALLIEGVSYMSVGGFLSAVASFVGQNYGAKKKDRIEKGYKVAMGIALGIGVFTTIAFVGFPKYLMMIFVDPVKEQLTMEAGINYLRIVGFSQMFMCAEIVTNGAYSGLGKPKIPSTVSIVVTSLRIPIAMVLSRDGLFGLSGVWIAISSTSILKGIISPLLYIREVKKLTFNNKKEC